MIESPFLFFSFLFFPALFLGFQEGEYESHSIYTTKLDRIRTKSSFRDEVRPSFGGPRGSSISIHSIFSSFIFIYYPLQNPNNSNGRNDGPSAAVSTRTASDAYTENPHTESRPRSIFPTYKIASAHPSSASAFSTHPQQEDSHCPALSIAGNNGIDPSTAAPSTSQTQREPLQCQRTQSELWDGPAISRQRTAIGSSGTRCSHAATAVKSTA